MKYNLADKTELKAARNRISYLARKQRVAEVKEIRNNRTLPQNSYLHLLLGMFGIEFGYTIEEAKQIYKLVNTNLYKYRKNSNKFGATFWRSSAELDTKEMTESIERFREWSNEQGCYLPPATNADEMRSLENLVEQNRRYL